MRATGGVDAHVYGAAHACRVSKDARFSTISADHTVKHVDRLRNRKQIEKRCAHSDRTKVLAVAARVCAR
jgi:hypothetical protein